MTERDMLDLKAYIFTLPAVAKANISHDINFPYGFRYSMYFWKLLFFKEGPLKKAPKQSEQWNRGAYLVKALLHCGECHTPRNAAGATISDMELAGTPDGPEGDLSPNVTPHVTTGIGKWSETDIMDLLDAGILPDGDFVGGAMRDVVGGAGKLSKADRKAIAIYLKALPPIANKVTAKPKPPTPKK